MKRRFAISVVLSGGVALLSCANQLPDDEIADDLTTTDISPADSALLRCVAYRAFEIGLGAAELKQRGVGSFEMSDETADAFLYACTHPMDPLDAARSRALKRAYDDSVHAAGGQTLDDMFGE